MAFAGPQIPYPLAKCFYVFSLGTFFTQRKCNRKMLGYYELCFMFKFDYLILTANQYFIFTFQSEILSNR